MDLKKEAAVNIRLSNETKSLLKNKLGKVPISDHIRELIEKDLAQHVEAPDPMSPTNIEDLARRLIGEIETQKLMMSIGDRSQPKELAKLLLARAHEAWKLPVEIINDLPHSFLSERDLIQSIEEMKPHEKLSGFLSVLFSKLKCVDNVSSSMVFGLPMDPGARKIAVVKECCELFELLLPESIIGHISAQPINEQLQLYASQIESMLLTIRQAADAGDENPINAIRPQLEFLAQRVSQRPEFRSPPLMAAEDKPAYPPTKKDQA